MQRLSIVGSIREMPRYELCFAAILAVDRSGSKWKVTAVTSFETSAIAGYGLSVNGERVRKERRVEGIPGSLLDPSTKGAIICWGDARRSSRLTVSRAVETTNLTPF